MKKYNRMFSKLKGLKEKVAKGLKIQTFPRSDTIDFPEVKQSINYALSSKSEAFTGYSNNGFQPIGSSFSLLNSGNILISYSQRRREKDANLVSYLEIYSLPELNPLKKYEFPYQEEGLIYEICTAFQLKNGNIFSIYDRFYTFDKESIEEGPIFSSNVCDSKYFSRREDVNFLDPYTKKETFRICANFFKGFFLEVKENKILYTNGYANNIFLFDPTEKETKLVALMEEQPHQFISLNDTTLYYDIILPSKYYPENLYVCANKGKSSSELLAFNLDEFVNKDIKKRSPIFNLVISESCNTFAMCEYDKKYLLFDTLSKGIYIFDMDTKTKVAVCDVEIFDDKIGLEHLNKSEIYLYRNLVKLEDGQVLRFNKFFFSVVDIKGRKEKKIHGNSSSRFFVVGKYLIATGGGYGLMVYQLYE